MNFLSNQTGQRLTAAVLGYIVLLIFLLTWNPFYLDLPEEVSLSLRVGPRDAIRNVVLFLPVGFLYRLMKGSPSGAILLGFAISAVAEMGQFFMPARTPSIVDLVTNTSGAGLGVLLHDLLATRITMSPRLVGRLALETPLMGLLYLMVPLLWVNRLITDDPSRWLLTVLIGMCGAVVLSDTYQQWWGPTSFGSLGRVALAAAIWFFIGIGPSLMVQPLPGFISLILIAVLTAVFAAFPRPAADHRFERVTLIRLLPVFILYLFLSTLWPLFQPITTWHGIFGITDQLIIDDVKINFRLLEHLAAFTVLGYIAAEWRGRSELPWRRDLPRLLLIAAVSALILEVLVGFQAGPGASLLRGMLAIFGALFGSLMYHLQRDHVRFLLGRPIVTEVASKSA
ncbi:MAG TPA: VanZ family protein [Anaerolineales bacterium]|nr:VanZ family protein [Anaerolineales bacterium]